MSCVSYVEVGCELCYFSSRQEFFPAKILKTGTNITNIIILLLWFAATNFDFWGSMRGAIRGAMRGATRGAMRGVIRGVMIYAMRDERSYERSYERSDKRCYDRERDNRNFIVHLMVTL